ncbi:mitochondrial ribonuclease P catalytic subunit [Nothobranchius furzeri]|uniref:Mitochondrial ribonuclease P catalytic subunit n=2 Tax=Nothobranchius furzeri TaxID=105023 RepID=A0A1A7ZDH7_NOTFU|nr:mitochondrial ribonuclease P catalytic subunit [Nothobranchius furzeri]KAF7211559.1 KIAA0391-like protein [Nothobranchius furzeri]
MGSNLILKVRLCLNSPLLPSSARFLCTQYIKSNLGGGQMDRRNSGQGDGQSRMKKITYKQDSEDGRSKKYTLRQLPSFPKSVFAAGTAKKIARIQQKKASLVSEDEEEPQRRTNRGAGKLQPPERPLPPDEWRKMKESLGNPNSFDCQMMTSLVTAGSDLDIAKSLLTFVAMETGTLSYELLLRYLTLCVIGGHDDEVFDVYKIMRGSFPSMDTGASTLFIKSFSRTERWKEAVGILQEVKKVFTPSQRNYHDVIAAAVQHGDTATAWSLYDELITNGKIPHQDTWDALFTCVKKTKEEEEEPEHQEKLLRILLYMRNNQIYPQESVAVKIRTWFESLKGPKWTGGWSSITPKGVCRCCGSELESIQLSAEEYQELKDKVMTDVIQGRDVFNKTTPEELERFKVFVKRKPAFDVVIDGLNVANINKDKNKQSDTLLAVVSALEDQGLNVLVLGRKHMLRPSRFWSKHNMSLIQQKAHCFFTDNISEDDPFLLYATLHSGNHCRFVSRDLMRDHKACLPDGASRRLFFKWQRGHQLVIGGHVAPGRSIRFQSIPEYDTIVQTTGDSWHIPYDDTEDRSTYEVPLRWLCLTKKH